MRDRREPDIEDIVSSGLYLLPLDFEGEAILTVGMAVEFIKAGARLVVNCAQVQSDTGVPVVSVVCDGEGDPNTILKVYLG